MSLTKVSFSMISNAPINVMDYGAVGNGTTDDTTAINAAIIAANAAGGNVVFSSMPHLITSPILMKSNVQLVLTNTLTCSGMSAYGANETDHSAVLFLGTSVSTSALTVAGASGDLTVTVASGSGFAVGDMVIVEDSSYFGSGTSAGVNSSLARVMNVATNVLTIDNPLPTAFPTATSIVRKVNLIQNASVTVATIAGAPYQGVTFQWARHCIVQDTEVNPIGKDAVYFHSAFGNLATNVNARNPQSVVSPFGYGCLFDFGASDNTLQNSYFEGIREISAGEYARRNTVRGCTIVAAFDSALNTHGLGAEDTLFESNFVTNSAQYAVAIGQLATSGKAADLRTVVRGNVILGSVNYAIREVQFTSGTSIATDTIIENNVINGTTTDAIFIAGSVATDNVNPTIRNNKIINAGAAGISLNGVSVKNCIVTGNEINTPSTDGIIVQATGGEVYISKNVVNAAGNNGIRLTSGTGATNNITIDNNSVKSSVAASIFIGELLVSNNLQATIRNNTVNGSGAEGIRLDGPGVKSSVVSGNMIDTTVSDGILLNGTGDDIVVSNNTVRNAGSRGIRNYAVGPRILLASNFVDNSTLDNYLNVGTAAPTAGTWKLGDIMPNAGSISAGANIGWACTAAGTPGTWKSMGTIAP